MTVIRLVALVALLILSACARSGEVTLAWDVVDDPRVGGYQILYGKTSGDYSGTVDVPGGQSANTYSVQGLDVAQRYYFVARAYNIDHTIYSGYSNEVNTVVRLDSPGSLSVTMHPDVPVNGSYLGAPLGVGL